MGGNYFDQIARNIIEQKQVMEQIEEENRELRRQIAELKAGSGIFIEINGQRFAMGSGEVITTAVSEQADQEASVEQVANVVAHEEAIEATPVATIAAPAATEEEQKAAEPKKTTFLEEIMIDEFATALTSPMKAIANKQGEPSEEQKNLSEEQKAQLRRQLLGSYILE